MEFYERGICIVVSTVNRVSIQTDPTMLTFFGIPKKIIIEGNFFHNMLSVSLI